MDVPLHVAEARDPKGLYAKARRGELANFTGIDSPYERPQNPDLRIDTTSLDPTEAAEAVVQLLEDPAGSDVAPKQRPPLDANVCGSATSGNRRSSKPNPGAKPTGSAFVLQSDGPVSPPAESSVGRMPD